MKKLLFVALVLVFNSTNAQFIDKGESSPSNTETARWLSCPEPTDFLANNNSFSSIDLSWTPGSTETSWEIEYGLDGFTQGNGTVVLIETNPYTLTGLDIDTDYDVYLRAICGAVPGDDDSNWVGPVSFSTLGINAPRYLTADVDQSTGEVLLNWQEGNESINEYFDDGIADNWVPVTGDWNVANSTYNVTSSTHTVSSSYYDAYFSNFEMEVRMRKTSGSDCNMSFNFNGDPNTIDSSGYWENGYKFLYCTSNGVWLLTKMENGVWTSIQDWEYSPQINLGIGAWNILKVIFADGYIDVYINEILQGSYFDNTFLAGNVGLSMGDANVLGSAEYDYVTLTDLSKNYTFGTINQSETRNVYATSACACDYESCQGEIIDTVLAPTPPFGANYTFTAKGTDDFLNYNVYRDGNIVGTATETTYTDNLPDYGTYNYHITALFDEGESDPSNTETLIWLSCPEPTNFLAYNNSFSSIDLSWTAGFEETFWEIEYGLDGFTQGNGTVIQIETNPYTLAGLDIDTNYDVYLRAICGAVPGDDDSNWVGPVSFSTLGIIPPRNLTADLDQLTGEVLLNWEEGTAGIDEYFDDGIANNWVPVTGDWNVANSTYNVTSSTHTVSSSYYDASFSNFEMEVRMRKTSGSDCNMSFNFNGGPNTIDSSGYWENGYKFLYCTSNGVWLLTKMENGVWTSIHDWEYSPQINTGIGAWNILKVIFADGYIDVYINEILQGSYFDNTFLAGNVGLSMGDANVLGSAEYDYVTLTDLSKNYTFGTINQSETRNVYATSACACDYESCQGEIIDTVLAPTPTFGTDYTYTAKGTDDFLNYNVYRDDVVVGTTTETTYTDNLPDYGTYEYHITALFDEGESDPSNTETVVWLSCPEPTDFLAYNNTYSSIDLSWTAGFEETSWEIEYGLDGFAQGTGTVIQIATNPYTLTGLDIDANYNVYLRANCGAVPGDDDSNWVGPVSFSTLGINPPRNLTADLDQLTGDVLLNWEEGTAGIDEYFDDGIANNWVPVTGDWNVANSTYNVTSSTHTVSSSYYDANFSNFELEVKMRKTLGLEYNLGVYFNGDHPNSINSAGDWNNGYVLMYSTSGDWKLGKIYNGVWTLIHDWGYSPQINIGMGAWNILKVVFADGYMDVFINDILQGSYFDNTFLSGKIGLKMYDDNIGSAEYDYVTLTDLSKNYTFGTVNQSETRNVYASGNCVNDYEFCQGEIIDTVLAPTPPFGANYTYTAKGTNDFLNYNVYRDDVVIGTATETTFTDNLPSYGTYEYHVTALFDEGESDPSNTVSVIYDGGPDINVYPTYLTETLEVGETSTQVLTITNSGNADLNFTISTTVQWLTLNPTDGIVVPSSHMDIEILFDATDLTAGVYNANLEVSSNDSNDPIVTIPVVLIVPSDLGVTENTIEGLICFPNPIDNDLYISADEVLDSVMIYNVLGKQVLNYNPDSESRIKLDTSSLGSETYFVRIKANSKISIFKIIKN